MGSHITRLEDLEAECGRLRQALAAERQTATLNAETHTLKIRALEDMVEAEAEARREAEGLSDAWQPIATAPMDGRVALVYRPLARNSQDEPIAMKRLVGGNNHCWETTVPEGASPYNPTSGSCHVTHWMPIPAPPAPSRSET